MVCRRLNLACAFAVLCLLSAAGTVSAQEGVQVKPWFHVIMDSSGSMRNSTSGNSCGYPSTRIGAAKCALYRVINGVGDAVFSLEQFAQVGTGTSCPSGHGSSAFPWDCYCFDGNACCAEGVDPCDNNATSGKMLVGVAEDNQDQIIHFVDGGPNCPYGEEIVPANYTPLGGSLALARDYFCAGSPGATPACGAAPAPFDVSPTASDDYAGCRPVSVILLTDGEETCGGNAVQRATELRSTLVPVPTSVDPSGYITLDIRTYVIGFGYTCPRTSLENVATAGGTDAPGSCTAFYAQNEEELSIAFSEIIADSQLIEVCNGEDDDCDGETDEGNPGGGDPCGPSTDVGECDYGALFCDEDTDGSKAGCDPDPDAASDSCFQCVGDPIGPVYPTTEVCDNKDNDCDGLTDENATDDGALQQTCGSDVGECETGVQLCSQGVWGTCVDEVAPTEEVCDTLDNDCDGLTDEDEFGDPLEQACGTDVGECISGTEVCSGGSWVGCDAVTESGEICDNKDNDCDGLTDLLVEACTETTDVGECDPGMRLCENGAWGDCFGVVGPVPEQCNNLDDDCDGTTDDFTRDCGPIGGICDPVETCTAGVWGACIGIPGTDEVCDNQDNDCDGITDEIVESCGSDVGECVSGTRTCSAGEWGNCDAVTESGEICDNKDNDCDGTTDEGLTRSCGKNVGECSAGTETCIGGIWENCDAVTETDEVCDNQDDDCDGLTDEGLTRVCGTDQGECEAGIEVCSFGAWAGCTADGGTDELCDDKDNDCDGLTDEELSRECGTNLGECSAGTETCSQGSWIDCDADTGTDELCNSLDDDCDGLTDEGNPQGGTPCGTTDVGECDYGSYRCVDGDLVCEGEVRSVPEKCNNRDDDCDGTTDEGNPGGGALCGTSTGECEKGTSICCTQQAFDLGQCTELGKLECQSGQGPISELCDGLDNDCDGEVDEGNPEGGARCDQVCDDEEPPNCQNVLEGVVDRVDGCAVIDVDHPDDPSYDLPCGQCRYGTVLCIDAELRCAGAVGPGDEICDGLDNDCDGQTDEVADDDGNDITTMDTRLNKPCGDDEGECQAGISVCLDGSIECQGEIPGSEEICDGLDNDCDGVTDEGIPLDEACGSAVGECHPGIFACCTPQLHGDGRCEVIGQAFCLGGVDATNEICDGLDNDCDGETDEDEDMCPSPAICIDCQCAYPCRTVDEFGQNCPSGKSAKQVPNLGCYCVAEKCTFDNCSAQVIERDGTTVCAPDSSQVGPCVCKENNCTFPCDGTVCSENTVCDPRDGRCRANTCMVFGCEQDQRCNAIEGECESDPCATADCAKGQVCRDGDCYQSCAEVQCDDGQKCVQGECVTDPCADLWCGRNKVCNPADGECVNDACASLTCPTGFLCDPVADACDPDPCLITRCPPGQICHAGKCSVRCGGQKIECDNRCVNPQTDPSYCGASGNCEGANAGVRCPQNQVCADGACTEECSTDTVNCGGICIDPETNSDFCGAVGDCTGENAGARCAEDEVCVNGVCSTSCRIGTIKCGDLCIDPQTDEDWCGASGDCQGTNAGSLCEDDEICESGVCFRQQVDEVAQEPKRSVAVAGGGCSCTVPAGSSTPGNGGAPWTAALLLLGLVALRLGRRFGIGGSLPLSATLRVALAFSLLVLAITASGCNIEPFCLNCEETPAAGPVDAASGAAGGGARQGEAGIRPDIDATVPEVDARSGECLQMELCNGEDDDCDGETDEDFDLNSDLNHCGSCEISCRRDHAFSECNQGSCVMSGCDSAFMDLDGDESNGCEYYCVKDAEEDTLCDLRDNDCDGQTDDEVDLDTDPMNCGSCGFVCKFAHAEDGGRCVDGECVLDTTKCDQGYHDIDGNQANGCEYECTVADPDGEVCNVKDDDCDGLIDEDADADGNDNSITSRDDRLAQVCGTEVGECETGITECRGGTVECIGGTDEQTEVCDGLDNNCDGETDESDLNTNKACADSGNTGFGMCQYGIWQCNKAIGELECVGQILPVAELCDGLDNDCDNDIDNDDPEGGEACGWASVGECRADSDGDGQTDDPCGTCLLGVRHCIGAELQCVGLKAPVDELCNLLDDDCDGETDEDNPESGDACGSGIGACEPGSYECIEGELVCTGGQDPVDEICNGIDDDCDRVRDEDLSRPCGPAEGDEGSCALGTEVCDVGNWVGCTAIWPEDEVCDNRDNDCDGITDEGLTRGCGNSLGECVRGIETCSGGLWEACTGITGTAEVCDNRDNDCDGLTDEELTRPCGTDEGECVSGIETCSGGAWLGCTATTGTDETCDNEDDDCDGLTDEGLAPRPCGTDTGQCTAGTENCVAGSWQECTGTPGSSETCDNEDDDCDGLTDEGNPEGGGVCGTTDVGQCEYGEWSCVDGGLQCIGEVTGTTEVCDYVDNDCDGENDEIEFNFAGNVYYCGDCSTNCWIECPFSVCHAYPKCESGTCGIDYCVAGYVDGNGIPTDGCECKSGPEICNNLDDDCDGATDEGVTRPCGTSVGECATGEEICSNGTWGSCSGGITATTEACDYLDNDCDGMTDEFFQVGTTCSVGIGSCLVSGKVDCDTTDLDGNTDTVTVCKDDIGGSLLLPGTPQDEQSYPCNALDDDCDGDVDEPCAPNNPQSGCVTDYWVELPSGTYIFAYEASRPDADTDSYGVSGLRACSGPDRMPWANLTHARAQEACAATGGRLCTEAEWEEACMYNNVTADGDCEWSYAEHEQASLGYDCNDYDSNTETCNANDWDADTDTAGDQDAIYPTGSFGYCHRQYQSNGLGPQVYDLSGNVKEWTVERSAGVNPLRGGSMNNTAEGVSCGFDWTLADDDFLFFNAGFRCCYGCYDVPAIRVGEYFIAAGEFTGTDYDLALTQDLVEDYFVIIQGSNNSTSDRGPNVSYVRLTSDPQATGELSQSSASDVIGLTRGDDADDWIGVVTVVESLMEQDTAGFQLLDVQEVSHGTSTSGTDTSASAWSDLSRTVLMGGFNGSGCSTAQDRALGHNTCWARIWPSSTNTINWERNSGGESLEAATSTVMVLQWGSEWTVQRVDVSGSASGGGVDSTGEYNHATISSVARDNTWIWGTGHTADTEVERGSEAVVITLGDGVNQNTNETQVAVGAESGTWRSFTVYALTHPDIAVDHRFKSDGGSGDYTRNVTVDDASGCGERFAVSYNSSDNGGDTYARPLWSARYYNDTTVRLQRTRNNERYAAWVQGIQMCITEHVCP